MTLKMWTLYDRPSDYPEAIVARRWSIEADGLAHSEPLTIVAATVQPIRDALAAAGLVGLPRAPDDDPIIMETWL